MCRTLWIFCRYGGKAVDKHNRQEALVRLLQQCTLGKGLSDAEAEQLLASSQVQLHQYGVGETVFYEGDEPRSLYILISGRVEILKDTYSGRRIFISEIDEAGDMFGEIYLVLRKPYDMYVRAAAPTQLLEISSSFINMAEGNPSGAISHMQLIIWQNLLRVFARKAYFMHSKLKVLASGSLREKIVRLLFQHLLPDGSGRTNLHLSREQLAAELAVTRPSLSRELGAMQRDGLIELSGRDISISDMERFEEYL